MSLFHFNAVPVFLLFLGLALPYSAKSHVADTTIAVTGVPKKEKSLKQSGLSFIPSNYMVQHAGSIGVVALGIGWDYGRKDQWSTDFLVGFVPKYDTDRIKTTLTLRQTYTPFQVKINEQIDYHPLRTGLYVSTTVGKQFWFSAPDKYPSNYYTFSTKLRFNAFVGQDFTYSFPSGTSYFEGVKFYYDLHTNDLYLISRIQNRYLSLRDYLGLSLGVKLQIRRK
ncbi:hypothetical protein ACS126_14395 [Sphingobacterium lactis]|uniref:hypothetical protein n=1 Tax=Sphingobacterium lactis TaxID=797291 RepID=UPI003EC6D3E9